MDRNVQDAQIYLSRDFGILQVHGVGVLSSAGRFSLGDPVLRPVLSLVLTLRIDFSHFW